MIIVGCQQAKGVQLGNKEYKLINFMIKLLCNKRNNYLLLRDINGSREINPGNLLTARWSCQRTCIAEVALQMLGNVFSQRKWIGHVHGFALPVNLAEQVGEALITPSGIDANLNMLEITN